MASNYGGEVAALMRPARRRMRPVSMLRVELLALLAAVFCSGAAVGVVLVSLVIS